HCRNRQMGEGGAVRGRHDGVVITAHDLSRKPVPTFRDHARGGHVRAAVMDGGVRPVYGDFAEPQETADARVVEVRAAALSGLDRNIAGRLHYLKMPDGPFVAGREGVARERDGRRIYFNVNAPVGPFGSMAERTLIDPKFSFPVPDGVADDVAAALGNA